LAEGVVVQTVRKDFEIIFSDLALGHVKSLNTRGSEHGAEVGPLGFLSLS
jgi:hypothetical protein